MKKLRKIKTKIITFLGILLFLPIVIFALDGLNLSSGQILKSSVWGNIKSVLINIKGNGNNIEISSSLKADGKLCLSTGECLGICNEGYYWNEETNICEKDKIINKTQCESAGWIWVPDTNDVKIGNREKTGFCISPKIGDIVGDPQYNDISWNGWGVDSDGDYKGWNSSASLNGKTVDDSGNFYPQYGQTKTLTHVNDTPVLYTCKGLGTLASGTGNVGGDTLVGRMKWLSNNKTNLTAIQNIPWIGSLTLKNSYSTPAIYIADCIDGVKDLGTTMTYIHNDNSTDEVTYAEYNEDESNTESILLTNTTYQNRQKYLTAWTQKSGSHLPSAFSFINDNTSGGCEGDGCTSNNLSGDERGEYQIACELYQNNSSATNNDFYYSTTNQSSDQHNAEWIWLSAVGAPDGAYWGRVARAIGSSGCSTQGFYHTGRTYGNESARFVVRP